MSAPTLLPMTNAQDPGTAILDHFSRQTYLGNEFAYTIDAYDLTVTAETPILLLSCPAAIQQTSPPVKSLFQDVKRLVCLTQGQSVVLRFYQNPTVTMVGTTKTPVNLRPASPTTSVAVLSQIPSTSSFGNLVTVLSSSSFASDDPSVLSILDPGQSLLVTAACTQNGTYFSFTLGWKEI